jgi:hypothetical protein
MPNFLSQIIINRFIQPAVEAGVEKALTTQPPAYGASVVAEVALAEEPQPPEAV